MERILASEKERAIIVTHGGTLTYLTSSWIKLPLAHAGHVKFKSTPGGITRLKEDSFSCDRQVTTLNETGHLK